MATKEEGVHEKYNIYTHIATPPPPPSYISIINVIHEQKVESFSVVKFVVIQFDIV